MKSKLTKDIESALYRHTTEQGMSFCFEVTIGYWGKERVDYLTHDTKGYFRAYEIKISKADFRSKAAHTFPGHFNYYVIYGPIFAEVESLIPQNVGVLTAYKNKTGIRITLVRKPKRNNNVDEHLLTISLLRSMAREVGKLYESADDTIIQHKNRQISQLKRERDTYYKQNWNNLKSGYIQGYKDAMEKRKPIYEFDVEKEIL